MKTVVLGLILMIVAVVAIVEYVPGPHQAATLPKAGYSPEFQTQARRTLTAIERLHSFAGTVPELEARKELDTLRDMPNQSARESNVFLVLMDYMYAIETYRITEAPKALAALQKARANVDAIRDRLQP